MTDRTLGVVVVGAGFGCRIHVPAARAAGLEVVAVVGRDPERTARRASRAGVDASFASLAEALRLPNADIVVIATPPDTHAELAEEAIAAGRHVLVEKPFTTTTADAQRLVDTAGKAGVVALVGHEFRFAPERVTLGRALRDGVIGPPRLATFISHMALVAPLDLRVQAWWFDRASGGGWLGASVSHVVDAIRTWLGEFASVSAVLPMVSDRDPATHAEDSVAARFRMQSGCEAVLQQSAATWGETVELLRIAGPKGTLGIDGTTVALADGDGVRHLDRVGPDLPVEVAESDDPRHRFTHIELGPAIVQAGVLHDLVHGRPPRSDIASPATFADGLASVEVMDAMRRSAAADGATTLVG